MRLPLETRRGERYPIAMTSLGEIICVGCGSHLVPNQHGPYRVLCSNTCASRVHYRGGRLTLQELQDRVGAVDEHLNMPRVPSSDVALTTAGRPLPRRRSRGIAR